MVTSKRRHSSTSGSDDTPASKKKANRSIQSDSDSEREIRPSPKKRSTPQKSNSKRSSDSGVRFRNTEMITKYKARNPSIKLQTVNEPSQLDAEDIESDDEVWVFQAPASMDVSKLVGKSLKLGSKNSVIQTDNDEAIECVMEKAAPKPMSMICPRRDSQLALVSFLSSGTILLRSKGSVDTEEDIDFNALISKQKVPFPDDLKIRHPIHGANYEEKMEIHESILSKLKEAEKSTAKKTKTKTRSGRAEGGEVREEVDISEVVKTEEVSPKKKSNKRKFVPDNDDDEVPFLPKKVKTIIETEDDTDLAWIKQL